MFEKTNETNRLERIEETLNKDYTKRHDTAILNLCPGDVKWLVEQTKKYKETLGIIAENKENQAETVEQIKALVKRVLIE